MAVSVGAVQAPPRRSYVERPKKNHGLYLAIKAIRDLGLWLKRSWCIHSYSTSDSAYLKDSLAARNLQTLKGLAGTEEELEDHLETLDGGLRSAGTLYSYSQIKNYKQKIRRLYDLLLQEPDGDGNKANRYHASEVFSALNDAVNDPIYEELVSQSSDNPLVIYLQRLSTTMMSNMVGTEQIRRFGQLLVDRDLSTATHEGLKNKEEYSYRDLGRVLDVLVDQRPHQKNTLLQKAWTYLKGHMVKALESALTLFPQHTDSYLAAGNMDIAVRDFRLGAKSLRFSHRASPAFDPAFFAHMDSMKRHGTVHLHHSLETTSHPGEKERLEMMYNLSKDPRFKDHFKLFTTSMDGKAWKMEDSFEYFEYPEEFYLTYAKHSLLGDASADGEFLNALDLGEPPIFQTKAGLERGFYVPENVMSADQVKGAFSHCSRAMQDIYEAKHPVEEGEALFPIHSIIRKEQGKMMQIALQGFVSVGAILNTLKEVENPTEEDVRHVVTQACKQNADRAMVANVMTLLFMKLLSKEGIALTKDEIHQIAGTVIGRAEIVDSRAPMDDRYKALSEFLHFVENPKNQAILQAHLRDYAQGPIGVDLAQIGVMDLDPIGV